MRCDTWPHVVEFPIRKTPDVSEAMAVSLHNEPQVTIARHLLTQAPIARMIPPSVSVEVFLMNWSRELVFMPADYVGEFPEPQQDWI